jgi:hypothetical protein
VILTSFSTSDRSTSLVYNASLYAPLFTVKKIRRIINP